MSLKALPQRSPGADRPPAVISPSILSADFARLAEEADDMERLGAPWLHVDVMDGHFVPNLTLGPPIIKSLRKHTKLYIDCHFMVSNPKQWVQDSAAAGSNMYTFHLEAVAPSCTEVNHPTPEAIELCQQIRQAGMDVGIAIKPGTPVDLLVPYVEDKLVDMVLIMTVEPGFGGQKFMPDMMSKVKVLRDKFPDLHIQVDGGLSPSTIGQAAESGANVIVAGSAIFGAQDRGAVIQTLRAAIDNAATSKS